MTGLMKPANIAIFVIFVGAFLVRLPGAFHPIDKASWRECDLGSVSRNFVSEGMDVFYPRIDWRGDGPGFAEMELPLYSYLTALTYKAFGVNDELGRLWSLLFSLGTLFFFFRLAREYLSTIPATIAFAFFAFNPLIVEESTAIQPEGLMLLAYVGAAYFFIKWLRTNSNADFLGAATLTALTLLAKASSAHIGIFFVILLLEKYGWEIIKQAKVWLFGAITLVPFALWYVHAKHLWTTYGNSLGVSNEYHWIGWDFFTNSYFIKGILKTEAIYVWVSAGILVAAFGIWRGYLDRTAKHGLIWLGAVYLFYIVASRTAADDWAYYYHAFSIPPFALLFGLGIKSIGEYARELGDSYGRSTVPQRLVQMLVVLLIIASTLATFAFEARQVRANVTEERVPSPGFVFAQGVKQQLPHDGPILVSGGHCRDNDGYQIAYNASYLLYWLDRKGWNICVEEQSVNNVSEYARKGAVYFVGEKKYLHEAFHFEQELRNVFAVTAETGDFVVFDLTRR